MRALRSEHLFHGGDIRTWLFTILTNLNRNRLRSLARRPRYADRGQRRARLRGAGGRRARHRARARLAGRGSAHRVAVGRAGRIDLSRSRRSAGRADRHRDVAARARARADQGLSRRRAPGAAPREVMQEGANDRSRSTGDRRRIARLLDGELAGRGRARSRPARAHPEDAARVAAWRAQADRSARALARSRTNRAGAARLDTLARAQVLWRASRPPPVPRLPLGGVAGWVGVARRCQRPDIGRDIAAEALERA